MKSEGLLEEIKSRIDIVDFISEYVNLKKAGQNYKSLCPFHSEKTPSFMVSAPKQIFHCFGCGAGGDIVTFLMKHDNISFAEALRYLAKKAGIEIEKFSFDRGLSEKREKLLLINREAMKYFIKNFQDSEMAKNYLKKRGISEECFHRFSIGYSFETRDSLFKHLKKMGYSDSLIKDAGLAVSDDRGYRDVFRRRIIFPICNYQNDVIAFGGRVLDDSLPKYLNSPETEIFKKNEILFALNLAKEEIKKAGYAIIVEGYLDAIVSHQYGFKNVVAPLGTALTTRHLQRLRLLTEKVILVFDSDEAGINAARRSLATICECNFSAKVLLLPKGEDPDSFLRKNGAESFKKMLSQSMSMIKFILNASRGDRIDAIKETLETISGMTDLIKTEELLGELVDRSKMNESVLRSELKKVKKKSGTSALEVLRHDRKSNKEEYLLMSGIIAFPEKAEYVLQRLDVATLRDETIRSLLKKVKTLGDTFSLSSLIDKADDKEKSLITELSLKPGFDLEHIDRNIDDCLHTLMIKSIDKKRKLAEESGDIELLNALLKERRRLMKKTES